ncbi:MAG: hypothetical protein ACSHX3_02785 [Litorimonas sp.]
MVSVSGQEIPIQSKRGGNFRVVPNAGTLEFSGWALNRHSGEIAEKIFIFSDGRPIGSAYPDAPSAGIAKHLKDERFNNSGINLIIEDDGDISIDKIRVFGTFPDGVAKELMQLSK